VDRNKPERSQQMHNKLKAVQNQQQIRNNTQQIEQVDFELSDAL